MLDNCKISILIPTFERPAFLKEAVASALAQDYPDLEVVVSDNGSSEETREAVAVFFSDARFKYSRNGANLGMVRNWRKALEELSSGDWFMLLSDDDYLTDPGYISRAAALIKGNPGLSMVYANGFIDDGSCRKEFSLPFDKIQSGLSVFLTRNALGQQDFTLCNVIFNRKLALEAGAFLNCYNLASDSELFLKMCLRGRVGFIKDPVSVYRVHQGNLLKTVAGDPELLLNHIDWCVQPYLEAKATHAFADADLAKWRKRVILNEAGTIYRSIMRFHRRRAPRLVRALLAKAGISPAEFAYIHLVLLRAWFTGLNRGGGMQA